MVALVSDARASKRAIKVVAHLLEYVDTDDITKSAPEYLVFGQSDQLGELAVDEMHDQVTVVVRDREIDRIEDEPELPRVLRHFERRRGGVVHGQAL